MSPKFQDTEKILGRQGKILSLDLFNIGTSSNLARNFHIFYFILFFLVFNFVNAYMHCVWNKGRGFMERPVHFLSVRGE